MFPLCGDAYEMELERIQRCQSPTDTMDNVDNWNIQWKLSKSCWNARKKMGEMPLPGVGQKNMTQTVIFMTKNLNYFVENEQTQA